VNLFDAQAFTPDDIQQVADYVNSSERNKLAFAEQIEQQLTEFLISHTEKDNIEEGIGLVAPTVDKIKSLLARNDVLYEAINLQRGVTIVEEMERPLEKELNYVLALLVWQETMMAELVTLFNTLPKLRDSMEKTRANQQLNDVFKRLLRNEDMRFEYADIIHEAQVSHITGLQESMQKGFFFHYTLEEELKKVGLDTIRLRIPKQQMEEVEEIARNITLIKRSIDKAYGINLRMIGMALVLYTYVKMLTTRDMM